MSTSPANAPGLFVAFEGGDGAGKSTQTRALAEALLEAGHEVVLTREPGGTPAAEAIRHVVLTPEFAGLDARAEALLYAASRAEHVARLVRPALERGAVVITDRYIDSSVAYQGVGRELASDEIRQLSLWAAEGLLPDITVLLDLDVSIGRSRLDDARTRYDRLESEAADFHGRVRDAYLALAAAEPERFLVLDATLPVDELAALVRARVSAALA